MNFSASDPVSKSLCAGLLCLILLPAALPAQDPSPEPQEQPEEVEPQEPATDESAPDDTAPSEEPEQPLTPKQEEAKRKAAERAAKREERQIKRQGKRELEEAKAVEKMERQATNRSAKAIEQADLGYQAIDAERYKAAADHFEKVKELEGGRSFAGEIGLARTEMAQGNYAQAVQIAQKALLSTPDPVLKAEALTLAGDATLATRPLVDGDPARPQPGTEMFADAAMRFYIRALELAPVDAADAQAALDRRFDTIAATPRAMRLLDHYLTNVPGAKREFGRLVATTYEALLSGVVPERPMAVVGPVSAPSRISGRRPRFVGVTEAPSPARAIVRLVIEADGSVTSVDLLNGTGEAWDDVVIEAMRLWVWEPARLPDGRTVKVYWLHNIDVLRE